MEHQQSDVLSYFYLYVVSKLTGYGSTEPPPYQQTDPMQPVVQQPMHGPLGQPPTAPPPPMQPPVVQQPLPAQHLMGPPIGSPIIQETTTTTVQITQQQYANARAYPQNVRDFTTGICGCCSDMKSCLMGCFCLPCLGCKLAVRVGEDCCCTGCFLSATSWVAMRTKLRTMYGIKGSIPMDFLCITCCPQLTLCQMARELEHFGL